MEQDCIERLPEDCLSHAISRTTHRDAARAAAVSSSFRSAADSDAVWGRFLPSGINWAQLLPGMKKKDVFFHLCRRPVLISSTMSVGLDRESGSSCVMLSPRALSIADADDPACWRWLPAHPHTDWFGEVAEMVEVRRWLEVIGKIPAAMLSRRAAYAAYLVFRLAGGSNGLECYIRYPLPTSTILLGDRILSHRSLCFRTRCRDHQPEKPGTAPRRFHLRPAAALRCTRTGMMSRQFFLKLWGEDEDEEDDAVASSSGAEVERQRWGGWKREDGLMEVEMGRFSLSADDVDGGAGAELEVRLLLNIEEEQAPPGHCITGLIIHGIHLRPLP